MLQSLRSTVQRGALGWALTLGLQLGAVAGSVDAPELAQAGAFAVGVKTVTMNVDALPGEETRPLDALLWYPAVGAPTSAARLARDVKNHAWRGWKTPTLNLSYPSVARKDALVLAPKPLPVLIVSHGLMNMGESFHAMAEHLASRGYAVLVIQHNDEGAADPLKSAIAYRPADQAAAWHRLRALDAEEAWTGKLQTDKIALLGYSMGGYGSLLSAGARLDKSGGLYQWTPLAQAHAEPQTDAQLAFKNSLAAVVVMAPWGAQAQFGGFKPTGLAGLRLPLLAIVGDQDDISGYQDGVRGAWESSVNAPRWLLTYENARHNIANSGMPNGLPMGFAAWEATEEPVWRRERLVDLNNHFITAFLDLYLRGDKQAAQWLTLAHERSNDGAWPVPFGTPASDKYAGPAKPPITSWQGFQRRWAVGMRLEHRDAQKS